MKLKVEEMKVVYILNTSVLHGGATKSFLVMLEGLIKKGIDPYIILPEEGLICNVLDKENIKYKILNYRFNIYPTFRKAHLIKDAVMYMPRLAKMLFLNHNSTIQLRKKIKEIQPDIIHTNASVTQIGTKVAKALNIPHIWHLREYQTLDFGIMPFPSLRNFRNDLSIPNNRCIAISKDIFEFFELNSNKDIVIYNGIMSEKSLRFSDQKDNYFLFVGSLQICKGIEVLLEVYGMLYTKLGKDSPPLLIAGDTSDEIYKNKLFKIVDKYQMSSKLKFLGNRNDVFDLMYKAKALFVPSLSEGFGRITVEALFNGCLVVGYNNAGTQEILAEKKLGLLYDSEEQLLEYMTDLAKNGVEQYFHMIQRAQEEIIQLYTSEMNVENTYNFYIEVLGKNKK